MESNKSAVLASSLTGIICDVRIRRSAGEHRTRLTSANRQRRRHWPPDAMARRCREFVDSRLRRSPPDRASAVPYGQAGENAMRFPRLAHRSAAAHKLHSTPQQDRMNLISGKGETSSRLPAFSLFLPGSCPNYRDRRILGFDFRYLRGLRGVMRPHYTPKLKKRTALLRELKQVFRRHRSQPIERVIILINPMLRGWVNYFAVGNSSECFTYIRDWVEKKVRRQLAHARKRKGFGWERWSRPWLYDTLGLFNSYRVRHDRPKVAPV